MSQIKWTHEFCDKIKSTNQRTQRITLLQAFNNLFQLLLWAKIITAHICRLVHLFRLVWYRRGLFFDILKTLFKDFEYNLIICRMKHTLSLPSAHPGFSYVNSRICKTPFRFSPVQKFRSHYVNFAFRLIMTFSCSWIVKW